jgi:hypothetical protein
MSLVERVLVFPAPAPPISMNEGDSWKVRIAAAAWRDRAYFAWCEAHPGEGPAGRAFPFPANVHIVLGFPTNRRRDPINFAKTVKHIVDGIMMAGAWPDDTPEYVTQNIPLLAKGGDCIVRVSALVPPSSVG